MSHVSGFPFSGRAIFRFLGHAALLLIRLLPQPLLATVNSAVSTSVQILFCFGGFWGSDRGRGGLGQRSWRFGFPRPAAQPHRAVPRLPEAQDSSCVKGSHRPPGWDAGAFKIMGHGARCQNCSRTDAPCRLVAGGQCWERSSQPWGQRPTSSIPLCISLSFCKMQRSARSALPQLRGLGMVLHELEQ